MIQSFLSSIVRPIALFLFYAYQPAFDESVFPTSGVKIYFQEPPLPLSLSPLRGRGESLRVVTHNMGYASGEKNNLAVELSLEEVQENLASMVAVLKPLNADVIALQEVDFNASRTFDIDQMGYLAKALRLPYAAYTVTWNKNYVPWPYWPPAVHFGKMLSGQVVLSRTPILSQEVITFDKPHDNAFWYNWFYLDRKVQKVMIGVDDGHVLVLWNVHLEAFSKAARGVQMRTLGQLVTNEKNPWQVVVGDFNAEPIGLVPFVSAFGPSCHATYPSKKPAECLDYILLPPAFTLSGFGTITLMSSDHLPVWAEFAP